MRARFAVAMITLFVWAGFAFAQGTPLDPDKLIPKRPVAAVAQSTPAASAQAAAPKVWDMDKTMVQLESVGTRKSSSDCAKYVRVAIEAGGVTLDRPKSNYAKDYGPSLVKVGFREHSDFKSAEFKKGDVVVIQNVKGHSNAGHIAIYDGKQWVSDFKQKNFNPYSNSPELSYKIYRREPPSGLSGNVAAAPKSNLGGVLINPVAEKDSKPLDPELSKKLLELKPGDSPVKRTIKLPKGKPDDAKDK